MPSAGFWRARTTLEGNGVSRGETPTRANGDRYPPVEAMEDVKEYMGAIADAADPAERIEAERAVEQARGPYRA